MTPKAQFSARLVLIAALSLTVGGTLIASARPASADPAIKGLKDPGALEMGTSAAYPPFEYVVDGKLVGFDIDLGNELARRMKLKPAWQEVDFKGIIAALKSRRVDILVTALTKTPERAKQVAFSIPYYDAGIGAAVPKDSKVSQPADLKGKTIGVQIGTSGERFVREHIPDAKSVKTYDTIIFALKDLENHRVDAVVNPLPAIRYNLRGVRGIKTTGVWASSFVGIAARKDDKELLAEIDKQLALMKKDGFLATLDKKWFEDAPKSGKK